MIRNKHVEKMLHDMYWEATRDCLVMMAGEAVANGPLTFDKIVDILKDKERIRDAEMRGVK